MTVKEMFEFIDEDYAGVFERLGEDLLIDRYLKKFENGHFGEELNANIKNENWGNAFKGSHSIKGMALNLGLSRLARISSAICETLRGDAPIPPEKELVDSFMLEYKRVINAVRQLD